MRRRYRVAAWLLLVPLAYRFGFAPFVLVLLAGTSGALKVCVCIALVLLAVFLPIGLWDLLGSPRRPAPGHPDEEAAIRAARLILRPPRR